MGRSHAQRVGAAGGLRLNLTPMIDVTFLLLIYFVLIADFKRPERDLPLPLPAPKSEPADPFALPETPITVTVTSVGEGADAYAVDATDSPLARAADAAGLASAARATLDMLGAGQPIVVQPRRDTRWEHAVRAYETLRSAGFGALTLTSPGSG